MEVGAVALKPEEHRRVAVEAFNAVWSFLEADEWSPDRVDSAIGLAHASRHHWRFAGGPTEASRGEWLLARLYAVLDRPEAAGFHAGRCRAIAESGELGAFDRGCAEEALARAALVTGSRREAREHLDLGRRWLAKVEDDEEREVLAADLDDLEARLSASPE